MSLLIKRVAYNELKDEEKNSFMELLKIKNSGLNSLIKKSSQNCKIDSIVICTILGGGYIEDIYYSWKENTIKPKKGCLVSGLFFNEKIPLINADEYSPERLQLISFLK